LKDSFVKVCFFIDAVVLLLVFALGAQVALATCQSSGYGLCYNNSWTKYADCDCDDYGCGRIGPPSIVCWRFRCDKDSYMCMGNYGPDMSDKICAPANSSLSQDCRAAG
jgi:hypothetical protein